MERESLLNVRNTLRKLGKLPVLQGGVKRLVLGLVLVLVMVQSGCLLRPPQTIRHVPAGEWNATLGGPARAAFAREAAPAEPRVVWETKVERGITAAPIVHGSLLILGMTGRVLATVSAESGKEYWHRRFNGPVIGTPLRAGNIIVTPTGSRDGRVWAHSIDRGRKLWIRRLHAPLVGEVVLAGSRVYGSTAARELYAFSVTRGDVAWRIRLPGQAVGAPIIHDDALLVGTTADTLLRLDLETGRVLARAALPATPSASGALAGNRLLIPLHDGTVAQLDAGTLALLRRDSIGERALAAPVVGQDGSAFVLTRTAELWRVGEGGATRIAALGGAAGESLTLARNGLLVGKLDGTLLFLRRDGSEVWRREFRGALRAPVALADGAAYVGVLNGKVVKLQ